MCLGNTGDGLSDSAPFRQVYNANADALSRNPTAEVCVVEVSPEGAFEPTERGSVEDTGTMEECLPRPEAAKLAEIRHLQGEDGSLKTMCN